jgi:tRNA A-37 threonylcarbamoyl transferase component Bud32
MTGCLDDNEASEFASGSLSGDAAARVDRHLATCRDCRSLVAALAPAPGEADADSDVVTSPRRAARGKPNRRRGGDALAIASTVLPAPESPSPSTVPGKKRRDPVVVAGDTIGRYIILARLGAGGMGVVYTAYDPQLDRKVALKLLRTGGIAEAEARSRLIREAQAIAQLSHPNVVAVYDVGTADTGEVYIAMELVEGETLTAWLGHWDRSWREILELFFQAGRGLAAAHARGLVHRDFKPDNVLVGTDGRVRVTDFGLARSLIEQVDELARDRPRPELEALRVTLTATGTVLGTPRYMAPEQLRGADADARSDQFSFCVALYEALYGRHPLPGDSVIELVQHGAEPDAPPTDTKVPPAIGRAITRGLATEPNRRFPTLAALLVELTPPAVHPGRRGWAAVLGGIALVAGGAAAAVVAQSEMQDDGSGEIRTLRDELAALREERDGLEDKLRRALHADGGLVASRAEVIELRKQLDQTRQKIAELEAAIDEVSDAAVTAVVRPARRVDARPPPLAGIPAPAFEAAVARQTARIESCVDEWIKRERDKPLRLVVTLKVGPDAIVRSADTSGLDDRQTSDCVKSAVIAAPFPASDAVTTGEVLVVVDGAGAPIAVSARRTGVDAAGRTIDLGP